MTKNDNTSDDGNNNKIYYSICFVHLYIFLTISIKCDKIINKIFDNF